MKTKDNSWYQTSKIPIQPIILHFQNQKKWIEINVFVLFVIVGKLGMNFILICPFYQVHYCIR